MFLDLDPGAEAEFTLLNLHFAVLADLVLAEGSARGGSLWTGVIMSTREWEKCRPKDVAHNDGLLAWAPSKHDEGKRRVGETYRHDTEAC